MSTASLYTRLSAASSDDNTGLRTQLADLRALAERHGLTVVAEHTDDGLSGALRDRPAFTAWLADAREGRATHLLAWKLDRVSRGSLQGLARFLDVLEGLDDDGRRVREPARFLSAADNLDSRAAGWDLQVAVLGAIAKGEREAMRTRMLAHRARARSEGRAVGGRRAWAFTTAPRPGGGQRLVPVFEHAAAIHWALEHLRDGGSVSSVVREWTALGVEPKGGKAWHVSPVRRILSNPNLYGATTHHDALLRNPDGTVRIDPGQAILSLSQWNELQALLARRSTSRDDPAREDPALLAGLLHCGSCGRVMYPHRPKGRTWTYRCSGAPCKAPTSIVLGPTEEFLVGEFKRLLGDAPEALGGWEPDVVPVDPEEAARLTEALRAVERVLSEDLDDDAALLAVRQRRDLRARLSEMQDAASAEPSGLREVASGRTYAEAFDSADSVPEKTRLLALAFDRITVRPGVQGGRSVFDPERLSW